MGLQAAPIQKAKKSIVTKVISGHLHRFKVLITVYTADEDRWSRKRLTATGMKLKNGIIAVDFRKIPAYSKVLIEGWGKFTAGDCGSAINSRKAARQRGLSCLVIDVFAENHAVAKKLLASNPELTYASICD